MQRKDHNTFGYLFRKLRLQAGIATLREFGNLLAERGYIYEDSIFSHWQNNSKIPRLRRILISIIEIFKEHGSQMDIKDYNALLASADHGFLTSTELNRLGITKNEEIIPFFAPPRLSHFIGREDEIESILKEITCHKSIQLYGLGGVGKTALAIEVAHRSIELFPNGVLWYRIDTTDISAILNHIARVYGENIDSVKDISLKSSIVRSIVSTKKILIILDNVDHIISKKLYNLFIAVEGINLIITTQNTYLSIDSAPFAIKIESFNEDSTNLLYKKINKSPASQEFLLLCKRYGYLPLVVNSLAKRIHYMNSNKLSYAYKDIEASPVSTFVYEDKSLNTFFQKVKKLLQKKEEKVWISTAVFNGVDFSIDAIRYINKLSLIESKQILEKLYHLSLIEKSVNDRWRIHPAIKKYLSSLLDNNYYFELANYYKESFIRNDNGYTSEYLKIEHEFDNIRYLLKRLLQKNSVEEAFTIWTFFSTYLWDRGYWYMFKDLGENLLSVVKKENLKEFEAVIAIRDLSWLYIWQGELLKAYKLLKDKELLNAVSDNDSLTTLASLRLGFIFCQYKQIDKSLKYLLHAQKYFYKTGDTHNLARTYLYIGNSYANVESLDSALMSYQKSFELADKSNFIETKSISLYYMGEVHRKKNNLTIAKKHFLSALSIDNSVKRRSGVGWNKHSLSEIARQEGDNDLATKLHKEAHIAFNSVGVNPIHLH